MKSPYSHHAPNTGTVGGTGAKGMRITTSCRVGKHHGPAKKKDIESFLIPPLITAIQTRLEIGGFHRKNMYKSWIFRQAMSDLPEGKLSEASNT